MKLWQWLLVAVGGGVLADCSGEEADVRPTPREPAPAVRQLEERVRQLEDKASVGSEADTEEPYWHQQSRIEKLDTRGTVVFPAGWYRGAGGGRPIIVSTLEDGTKVALLSLFTRQTPEGVQLGHDDGTYQFHGFRSIGRDGKPESYSSDSEGGWGHDEPLPLYELVSMQSTQTGFPERVEAVKHLSRYVVGAELDAYDPIVHDVASLSADEERLAMRLDEPDCVVSVLYAGRFPQAGDGWAKVVAERTDTLDALGRPVYRATSLEVAERPLETTPDLTTGN